jgi:hypothetical protein
MTKLPLNAMDESHGPGFSAGQMPITIPLTLGMVGKGSATDTEVSSSAKPANSYGQRRASRCQTKRSDTKGWIRLAGR